MIPSMKRLVVNNKITHRPLIRGLAICCRSCTYPDINININFTTRDSNSRLPLISRYNLMNKRFYSSDGKDKGPSRDKIESDKMKLGSTDSPSSKAEYAPEISSPSKNQETPLLNKDEIKRTNDEINEITGGAKKERNDINDYIHSNENNQILTSKVLRPLLSSNSSYISCTIFDESGNVTAVSEKFPKMNFLNDNGLFPRDLRKIDSSNVDVAPTIAVRSNGILINLLHIKAIIKSNTVMVFDISSNDNSAKLGLFMYDLESKLRTKIIHGANSSGQSYEFRALESILINVMAVLEAELKDHSKLCGGILTDLEHQLDREKLRDLLVYSKALTTFYQKALLIRNALDELLDNDEDLEAMYLTENEEFRKKLLSKENVLIKSMNGEYSENMKGNNNSPHAVKGTTNNLGHDNIISHPNLINSTEHVSSINSVNSSNLYYQGNSNISKEKKKHLNLITIFDNNSELDTGEIEMLLESYYKQCDEIVQQSETLINDIKSTEEIVNIILDANRNSLMVYELKITIYTLGITVATTLPAFYGMNLKNFIEESTIAFGVVVGFSILSGLSIILFCFRKLSFVQKMTRMVRNPITSIDEKINRLKIDLDEMKNRNVKEAAENLSKDSNLLENQIKLSNLSEISKLTGFKNEKKLEELQNLSYSSVESNDNSSDNSASSSASASARVSASKAAKAEAKLSASLKARKRKLSNPFANFKFHWWNARKANKHIDPQQRDMVWKWLKNSK